MNDQERRTDEAGHEIAEQNDDATGYEAPRLAVIGSLEELTQGAPGLGADMETAVS
jgi:hypothetical protein